MATVVRLLQNYTLSGVNYQANDLVSIDDALATSLVAGKIADNNANAIAAAQAAGEVTRTPSVDEVEIAPKRYKSG